MQDVCIINASWLQPFHRTTCGSVALNRTPRIAFHVSKHYLELYTNSCTPPSLMAFVVDGIYLARDFFGEELPSFSFKPSETELEGPRPRTKRSRYGHQLRGSQMRTVIHRRLDVLGNRSYLTKHSKSYDAGTAFRRRHLGRRRYIRPAGALTEHGTNAHRKCAPAPVLWSRRFAHTNTSLVVTGTPKTSPFSTDGEHIW